MTRFDARFLDTTLALSLLAACGPAPTGPLTNRDPLDLGRLVVEDADQADLTDHRLTGSWARYP